MFAREYADYRQPAPLDPERHFYQDGTDPAVRNDDEAVVEPKPATLQDLHRIALVFLQVQRCAKSVGADDTEMRGERHLHECDKTGKASLARDHLFAHHPGMSGAKEKDQSPFGDALRAKIGRLLDLRHLRFAESIQQLPRPLKVCESCAHVEAHCTQKTYGSLRLSRSSWCEEEGYAAFTAKTQRITNGGRRPARRAPLECHGFPAGRGTSPCFPAGQRDARQRP